MPSATGLKRTLTDISPLYVVLGAGGLALARFRRIPAEVRSIPERTQDFTFMQAGRAAETYLELAERGKHLVTQIRR